MAINPTYGGAVGGAATGAAMGTMVAPGIGTIIGAGVGGLAGALSGMGANSARRAQEAAIAAQQGATRSEMERRAQGVAGAREAFGDLSQWKDPGAGPGGYQPGSKGKIINAKSALWAGLGSAFGLSGAAIGGALGMKKGRKPFTPYDERLQNANYYQNLDKTTLRHGQLAGGIEDQAAATREAGQQQLTGAAQQAAGATRSSIAGRGLLGSSMADSAKLGLLGQYGAGRGNVAAATEATRQGGWDALKAQQMGFENAALGGSDTSGQLRSLNQAGQIAGARAQMPYTMFGNLLNTGMGLFGTAATAEAAGGQGLAALGLPSLGVGPNKGKSNKATGGNTSGG